MSGGGGGSASSEKFCLKWNEFESNVSTAFRELREDKDFFDVTLACDGNQLEAHKVILSACSPFFRGVLKRNPHAHPLLYLKGIKYEDVLAVLNFMYHGEVNIAQDDLNSFLAVAEDLQVKGLTQNSHPPSSSLPKPRPPEPQQRPKQARPPPPPRQSYEPPQQQLQAPPPALGMVQVEAGNNIKTEPQQQLVDLEEEGLGYGEEGEEEEEYQYGGQDYHYQEDMQQGGGLGETAAAGNDRNILLKYITKIVNKNGAEDMWKCDICGKTGARKDNVHNHVENIHFPGTFEYKCQICSKEMPTKKALNNHIQRNHKEGEPRIILQTNFVE